MEVFEKITDIFWECWFAVQVAYWVCVNAATPVFWRCVDFLRPAYLFCEAIVLTVVGYFEMLYGIYMGWVMWLMSWTQVPDELLLIVVLVVIGVIVVFAGIDAIMGLIAWLIGRAKGRHGCFWWGFLLSWIGVIIVACGRTRRRVSTVNDNPAPRPDALELMDEDSQMWFCPGCGAAHPSTDTECACGIRKKA